MEGFARWLVRHSLAVVAANLLLTIVLGTSAVHIRVVSSIASMLPAGDPAAAYYDAVRETFGSDDVAVVGLRADDVFATSTLQKIARLTDALGRIDGVERAVSLTNAVDPAADVFDPPKLLETIPPDAEQLAELKHKLHTTTIYGKNLVADDFRGAAINVFLRNMSDAEYVERQVDEKIAAVLATEHGSEQLYFTGASHLKQAAVELMRHDLLRFTPVAILIVLVVLWLSFRSVRGVVLPVLSVLMAVVWTLGVMVLSGKSITLGTFVLPPLLIVIGSSYAIHVIARYEEQVAAAAPPEDRVRRAFLRVWLPLSISALTVAIGFGALMVNRITAIWDLGCFAVVGIVCLAITSLTFMPAALQLLPAQRTSVVATSRGSSWLADLLARVGEQAYLRRRAILWIAAGLAAVAIVGALHIRVDSDFLAYFTPRSEVRRDNETINREIVGSNPFYLVVEGSTPGALKRFEVLKQIKDLQAYLATVPGITSSLSLIDYLELLDTGLNKTAEGDVILDDQGNPAPQAPLKPLWDEPARFEPVLDIVTKSPGTFKSVVTPDFSRANILVRTNLSGSRAIEEALEKIRAWIAVHLPGDLHVRPTGNLVLLTGTASDIVSGQIESLSLALAVIFLVMSLMFLSVKVGFLAILPNILPILIFFGVMGWLGIFLNLGTSLIAAIALGIAVDSTIHYMARLNIELRGETDQAAATVRTSRTVGIPIVYATVALFFGFFTFAFSSFVPIQNFGVLTGVTLLAALVSNLVLLPALLATTKIITLWDLAAVRLGEHPEKTIPLFAGLRRGQARIVVLMGHLRRFSAGETIVRRGDEGDEMFVILQGKAEVFAGDSVGGERRVGEHRRGDVFGEMALVRQGQRSADVRAASDVEVLAVDRRFLERIESRYPRIAARVFLNLTRILSDRLQRMTDLFAARAP